MISEYLASAGSYRELWNENHGTESACFEARELASKQCPVPVNQGVTACGERRTVSRMWLRLAKDSSCFGDLEKGAAEI